MLTSDPYSSVNFAAQLNISKVHRNLPKWKNAVKDFSHLTARYPDYTVSVNENTNLITVRNIQKNGKKILSEDVFEKEDGVQSLLDLGVRDAVKLLKAALKKVVNEKKLTGRQVNARLNMQKKREVTACSVRGGIDCCLDEIDVILAENGISKIS